jgi:CheY-like chemotaxis protein/anti-sigma regulatory factor (Ser/Thr protein kinase)
VQRILVVDDEAGIRTLLADILLPRWQVTTAAGSAEALALCAAERFDMIISDIMMPDGNGMDLLTEVKRRWPAVITVLMTGYDVNRYLREAREHGISNIIAKTAPLNFREIVTEVETLLTGAIFGLRRHLLDDGQLLRRFEVRSSAESRTVRHEVVGLIAERFGSAGHLELVLDEVLTNAVYHAPARLDGRPKHERYAEVRLEEQEVVEVECGSDSEKYGVAVTDHSGRLTRETVLQRIERHVSGQGTLDEHGRGIHLSRVFSDRMIINIKPGARTEVILMNYFAPKYRGFKPLYINEL